MVAKLKSSSIFLSIDVGAVLTMAFDIVWNELLLPNKQS